MPSRQAEWAKAHRKSGLCTRDSRPAWKGGLCFQCALVVEFSKRGMLAEAKRHGPSWRKFVAGMAARYERILKVEGFAVDAVMGPELVIAESGMGIWAKYKERKKVLEIIARFDDRAIRERFRGAR
jgi:hypothetical protein